MTIQKTWDLFYVPNYCVEVRALGLSGNNRLWEGYAGGAVVGYFNDYPSFYKCVTDLDKLNCKGIYVQCNPVKPELLARANNRLIGANKENATKETDIAFRRWLRIDVDPVRPSGISSSREELQASVDLARHIAIGLETDGWGKAIIATSGNGADLLYRIDLANTPEAKEIVKATLSYICEKYCTDKVNVDTNLIAANVQTKVYGTVARKGDSTQDRPHRRSQIIDIPGEYKLVTDLLIKPQPRQPRKEIQRSFNDAPTHEQVEEWLSYLPNPVGEYSDWVKVLMSVHSVLGDDGIELCEKYIPGTEGEVAQKFKTFHRNGTGIGTLVEYAKRHGWTAPVNDRKHYQNNSDESSTADLDLDTKTTIEPARSYTADESTMYRILPAKRKNEEDLELPISDFIARISGVIVSEHGDKTYTITGNAKRGGQFTCEISAKDFEESRKLKGELGAAAGALDPVHAGMTEHLNPAIKALSQGNSVTYSRRYNRTGWADNKFLIPGHEGEGVEIILPTKLAYSFDPGDALKGAEALNHLIAFMGEDVGSIIVGHILSAPMAKVAGWSNERYGLFLKGRTGTHKTSVMQCLMSIYGHGYMNRENLIQWGKKFGSTLNALMGYARYASDLPMLIDNYKPLNTEDAREMISLVHALMEGSDKDRLNRHSQLQESAPFRCWPVFTGEDLPDSDAAALARLVTIQSRKNDDTSELTQAQQLSKHLPAVGASWIAWLETDAAQATVTQEAQSLGELRDKFAEHIKATTPEAKNPYRIASNLATNLILWRALCHHPELGEFAKMHIDGHEQKLQNLSVAIAEQTSEATEAQQLLARIIELVVAGKLLIANKSQKVEANETLIGWYVSDLPNDKSSGAYLLLDIAKQAVNRLTGFDLNGFSNRTLCDQLDELGALGKLRDPGRKTKQVRINGSRVSVVHITGAAMFGEDDLGL